MYYLGVDGGGTKTAFIIINEKGKILSYFTDKSCHYLQNGWDVYRDVLNRGIRKVCKDIDITKNDIDFSFFGIPCYGEYEEDIPLLEGIVKEVLENDNFECGNDVKAGWAGSLACQPGINIVAGTGAIGFGVDQNGKSARASGWGYFCGDEGSGYWLGKKLISLFTKEADGRLEKTPLYYLVREKFNLDKDFEMISVVYDELERKRDKIAQLAVILDQAAAQKDKKVLKLFEKAAYEHSLTVKALINKLDFKKNNTILVSYSGGVFKAGSYILDPFQNYISEFGAELKKPLLKPITGAALYALKLDGKVRNWEELVDILQKEEKNI